MEKPHLLPRPHTCIGKSWNPEEVREAVEKSRAALRNFSASSSTSQQQQQHHAAAADSDDVLIKKLFLVNNELQNLFLVDTTPFQNGDERTIFYYSYGFMPPAWEWGSRDMMFDLRDSSMELRTAFLTAAANLTGGAVHLLLQGYNSLTEEEERVWVEALSLAADDDAGPTTLLIQAYKFRDAHGLLSALKRNKRLKHLSFHGMKFDDECFDVLRDFTSLTTLHLHHVSVPKEFVGKLADLHPSHSPLAASLQRLHQHDLPIDWRRSTGFLRHWPKLKELALKYSKDMTEEELMDFMDYLAPPKKGAETAGNIHSSPPQLYSLELSGLRSNELSRSAIAAVVDALSRSGLPFFELGINSDTMDAAIEAQLWRNQRNYLLGSDLKRVPATSIRLFICGDPFAGKTTLVSTMRSMYGRKRDRLRALFTGERTKGIEVQAIKKDGIRVSLWDMAGQQQFHAFHDCMFPDIGTSSYHFPSMFMFVWSPMNSQSSDRGAEKRVGDFEASFRYWLRFLASKSRQSIIPLKVILVFTRADQMELVSSSVLNSVNSLQLEFRKVIDIVDHQFDVDARNKDSVKPVAEHIFSIARNVLQGIELYDICTQVRKKLLNYSKMTNERIITWEEFKKICNNDDKAKLNAIAMSLNESGNIIYVSGFKHIVLDPNWFCNQIVGSLFDFPRSGASKGIVGFEKGCMPRHVLDKKFESMAAKSNVKGSLLVDLMEAMHLCCKVPKEATGLIFIPAILSDVGVQQLQWSHKDGTSVYMGRRLECENKDLTFLTPGLFPRIQVLILNAFQSKNDKIDIKLGKNFITIFLPKCEVIIVFCQAKSNHVIDVLMQTYQNIDAEKKDMQHILAFVENRIINTLINICAQPTGVQGVKLIESVIRPDCLHNPSEARDREEQCVEVTYLKAKLRKRLERGEKQSYDWKRTRHMSSPLSNDLIDLLGPVYYGDVCKSIKKWFQVEVRDVLLENDEIIDKSTTYKSYENVIMSILENGTVQEDQLTLEEAREVQSNKVLVKLLLSLHHKTDATHKNVLKLHDKMDQMTKELQSMRIDVLTKLENSISKLLKIALENEAEKQLPWVAILTTKFPESTLEELLRWVPRTMGGKIIRIHLYCEDKKSPHPVENQPGITLTSLSESQSKYLEEALPYINYSFQVLSIIAKLSIPFMTSLPSSSIPNWKRHFKTTKQYPMLQIHFGLEKDIVLSTMEFASREWQKCLASILRDNDGLTSENIAKKFHLNRTIHDESDGSAHVAWLCNRHSEGKRLVPLG